MGLPCTYTNKVSGSWEFRKEKNTKAQHREKVE
jgi:hypothetical protein